MFLRFQAASVDADHSFYSFLFFYLCSKDHKTEIQKVVDGLQIRLTQTKKDTHRPQGGAVTNKLTFINYLENSLT